MRRLSLTLQMFLAILVVVLGAVLAVGLIARSSLAAAFDTYLAGLPAPRAGHGMGRRMLGGAEQTFIATVDRSVYIGAAIAIVIAAVGALALAAYLSRPIRRLETAAETIAEGDRSHRVEVSGPAEVAALGDAFNRMADSIEEGEQLRRRMVADVSHELRNPIAAARAQAEGMAEGILPADRAGLESLVDDMKHLSALVDDLQVLAVAEAGNLSYDMAPTDVSELVAQSAARFAGIAPEGIEVRAVGVGTPAVVEGDERRLSEVLRNLFSNALRHTVTGSVTAQVEQADGFVTVRVVDTGEGIPAADLPYVFERFYRADAARAADTGGAGLGLAISRRIIEDHGGSVFAESTSGDGATVGFRLPLAEV